VTETTLFPANKPELLERMGADRAAWDALVSQVPDHLASDPLLPNGWSVKDVMAHIAAHEEWRTQRMNEDLGVSPIPTPDTDETGADAAAEGESDGEPVWDTDTINAMIYEQYKEDDLPTVEAFAARSFQDMIAAFDAAPNDYLNQPSWWTGGSTVMEMVPAQTSDHYAQHEDDLRAVTAKLAG